MKFHMIRVWTSFNWFLIVVLHSPPPSVKSAKTKVLWRLCVGCCMASWCFMWPFTPLQSHFIHFPWRSLYINQFQYQPYSCVFVNNLMQKLATLDNLYLTFSSHHQTQQWNLGDWVPHATSSTHRMPRRPTVRSRWCVDDGGIQWKYIYILYKKNSPEI